MDVTNIYLFRSYSLYSSLSLVHNSGQLLTWNSSAKYIKTKCQPVHLTWSVYNIVFVNIVQANQPTTFVLIHLFFVFQPDQPDQELNKMEREKTSHSFPQKMVCYKSSSL